LFIVGVGFVIMGLLIVKRPFATNCEDYDAVR
jgi:hypothetical protein